MECVSLTPDKSATVAVTSKSKYVSEETLKCAEDTRKAPLKERVESADVEDVLKGYCSEAAVHDDSITDSVYCSGVRPSACGACLVKDPEHE